MAYYIHITGHERVGKDTVASLLESTLERYLAGTAYVPIIQSCATPLKEEVCNILNISMDILERDKDLMQPVHYDCLSFQTYREFLIYYSEHVVKAQYGKDIWARKLTNTIRAKELKDKRRYIVIVPDMRYNEDYDSTRTVLENIVVINKNSLGTVENTPYKKLVDEKIELAFTSDEYLLVNNSYSLAVLQNTVQEIANLVCSSILKRPH